MQYMCTCICMSVYMTGCIHDVYILLGGVLMCI